MLDPKHTLSHFVTTSGIKNRGRFYERSTSLFLEQILHADVRDEGTDTRLRTNDRFSFAVYKPKLLQVENSERQVGIRWRYIHSSTAQPPSNSSWQNKKIPFKRIDALQNGSRNAVNSLTPFLSPYPCSLYTRNITGRVYIFYMDERVPHHCVVVCSQLTSTRGATLLFCLQRMVANLLY